MRVILLFVVLCVVSLKTFAYSFEVNGIYYNINYENVIVTYGPNKYSGVVIIPEVVSYNNKNYQVTSIGDGAFSGCYGLTSITIPNSVTSIGKYAFSACSRLTSITIPNSVRTIGVSAFEYCTGMTDVILSNSIMRIECLVFAECNNLVNVLMPNSLQYINNKAFKNCTGLKNITFPSSVKAIGNGAFDGCTGLYSLVIPDSTTHLGGDMVTGTAEYWNNGPFSGCTGLTFVTIGESVSNIYENTFKGCTNITQLTWNAIDCASNGDMPTSNIEQVLIGKRVKTLPSNFVKDSRITNVIIPDSITKICSNAFNNCRKLKNITIPYPVTYIGNAAFYYCEDLTDVICLAKTPPTMGDYNSLYPAYQMATLHVPERSINAYKATNWWNCFLNIVGDATENNPSDNSDYLKCDTNGDGEVNIADVNRVIDAILSH